MRRLSSVQWLVLLLLLPFVAITVAAAEADDEPDEADLIVKETIAAGRGHRDEKGERDQWASTEHIGGKFDTRRPISAKVKALLSQYRLECEGCDQAQAVAKINEFIQQAKEEAKREEEAKSQRFVWMTTTIVAVLLGGMVVYFKEEWLQFLFPSNAGKIAAADRQREIEKQRERAAQAAEERVKAEAAAVPPNWREVEEKEVWTSKQEKQFVKALMAFGGVPPKARYTLIADKVEGKTRNQCNMHHKLLMAKEKEAKDE